MNTNYLYYLRTISTVLDFSLFYNNFQLKSEVKKKNEMICVCNIFIVLSLKASYLRSSAAESRKVVVVSSDKNIKIFQFVQLFTRSLLLASLVDWV